MPPLRAGQVLHRLELNPLHRGRHQLGDAVAVGNGKALRAQVHQNDLHLAPVVAVDDAYAVGKAMATIQANSLQKRRSVKFSD